MRSDAEAEAEAASVPETKGQIAAEEAPRASEDDKYGKGVVFYLNKEDRVVGLLMWNVFNRMGLARKVIRENRQYEDLAELAKLFNIHGEESAQEQEPEAQEGQQQQ